MYSACRLIIAVTLLRVLSSSTVSKMLKALPEAENTKFYSQSGWGSGKYIEDSKSAGFDEHFVKPLSKETIKSVLS